MSEPIQAISQGNYILHNIDAKKLYVQEPLFTANSGDAVYVGWRPDETVLWEGTATTANLPVSLNESISGFDYVRIDYNCWDSDVYSTTIPTNTVAYQLYAQWLDNSNGWYSFCYKLSANADKTQLGMVKGGYCSWANTSVANNTSQFKLYKVIGVNRKENA